MYIDLSNVRGISHPVLSNIIRKISETYPPISREETNLLFKKLKDSEHIDGRDKIVEEICYRNILLLSKIAARYTNEFHNFEENFSNGYIFLSKAVNKYDVTSKASFSYFATQQIVGFLLEEFKKDKLVKCWNGDDVLIDRYDIQVDDKNSWETIEGDYDDPLEYTEKQFDLKVVMERVNRILNEEEIKILTYLYGLNDQKVLSISEIARELKCSNNWVTIKHQRILKKLKKCI